MMSSGEKVKLFGILAGLGILFAVIIGLISARKPGAPIEVSGKLVGIYQEQSEEPGPNRFIVELQKGKRTMVVPAPGVIFDKDALVILYEYPMTLGQPRYQWKRYKREDS